jgi:AraC family transcriptional regulator
MSEAQPEAGRSLAPGSFFGAVQGRHERCNAIFTVLRHQQPKRLPSHSHELPFFGLLLEGLYGERYRRQDKQFRPFTVMFRPSGVPHQDEIGPTGVKLFEIELRPSWRNRLEDCSAVLDAGCDDCMGGELLWLAMKLFCEVHGSADELLIESLLAELLFEVATMPRKELKQPPSWLPRVMDRVKCEHSARLTLEDLSGEAGVHPVHLSRVFRKFAGEGIGEYVRRLRIRSACEQMLTPEIPMAEISLATGFADQSHFTRCFRQVTGMTPAKFRAAVAEGNSASTGPVIGRTSDSGSTRP